MLGARAVEPRQSHLRVKNYFFPASFNFETGAGEYPIENIFMGCNFNANPKNN